MGGWRSSGKDSSSWGCRGRKGEVKCEGGWWAGLDHRGLEGQAREGWPPPTPRKDLCCPCILEVMAHVCTAPTSWGCSELFTCINSFTWYSPALR